MILRRQAAFALVITLVLLALLVLATFALCSLASVSAGISETSLYQLQARQNAQLALDSALGELQRLAGRDDRLTGLAGLTGIPAGADHPARHWCGVWDANGSFLGWLASGGGAAQPPTMADDGNSVAVLATGALGADATDKEHVRVPLVPIRFTTGAGGDYRSGSMAWWVGDEGVKLSAVIADEESPVPGGRHALSELIASLAPDHPNLPRVETYEQLAHVPATGLTPGQLQSNLHALGRTHRRWTPAARVAGQMNINTTTARFWRGLAATYNRLKAVEAAPIAPAGFANGMRDQMPLADPEAGKPAGGPFPTVEAFLGSVALRNAVEQNGGEVAAFTGVMRPWLAVRSDTFRVRIHGDARNRAAPAKVEAVAWAEAIVQRMKTTPADPGSRFVIVNFRWLGPDDI